VAYAGCTGATFGGGAIACGVVAGAAAGAASNLWSTQVQHTEEFSVGSLATDTVVGGIIGGVTAGVGRIPIVRRAASSVANRVANSAIGQRVGAAASSLRSTLTGSGRSAASGPNVFFSGGTRDVANRWAAANGGRTINRTPTGRALELVDRVVPYRYTLPLWRAASARFARGTTGTAHVFLGLDAPLRNSVFWRTELPILRQNGVSLIQHGGWTGV
jgi:hypothetical protein